MLIIKYQLKLSSTAQKLGEIIMEDIFSKGFQVRKLVDDSFLFIGYQSAGKQQGEFSSKQIWQKLLKKLAFHQQELRDAGGYILRRQQEKEFNWVQNFQENYQEVYPLNGWVIFPPWKKNANKSSEILKKQSELKKIIIEPGIAFGTGTHASTVLAFRLLDEVTDYQEKFTAFLDAGCGSGILTIAASKMGLNNITAIDIEPESIANTKRNLALNNLANKSGIKIHQQDIIAHCQKKIARRQKYDIITVNCLAVILLEVIPFLFEILAEQGYLIISGFEFEQEDSIIDVILNNQQVKFIKRTAKEGWVAYLVQKESKS